MSMPGTSKGNVESLPGGGVGTGAPWPPEVPHWPSVTCCSGTKPNSRVGEGSEVSPCTCQELERGAGTGGGDRGEWRQNLEKGKGPKEEHNLGRRARHPGKVMREEDSGSGEGRGVLAGGPWVSEERHWVFPGSGESCRVWGQKRMVGCGGE